MNEFGRKIFCERRLIVYKSAVRQHDFHGTGIVEHHVEHRFTGPALGDHALEHGGAGGAPIFHRDAGFLFERLAYAFENILFHRAVDDDLAFFLALRR